MTKKIYRLTPEEIEIMKLGTVDPNIITDYFVRAPGEEKGFNFDHNFEEEGKWQIAVHQASQSDIVVVGAFGTGKTLGIGMSAFVYCLLMPYFKFLNVAPTAWQASQMYDAVLEAVDGTRAERFIYKAPKSPYRKIEIKYIYGDMTINSSMEFMSADRNSRNILSWSGDWVNMDEAGLNEPEMLETMVTNLGSRTRGRVHGRDRLGRMSMISNSQDNFYLWYYFDLAKDDSDNVLSMIVSTKHNKNITKKQLEDMIRRTPAEDRARLLEAARPKGRGTYFGIENIDACKDVIEGEKIVKQSKDIVIERSPRAGVVLYETKPKPGHMYMVLGDPGIDNAPKRNSPVLMVWDVTFMPSKPAVLSAFSWGSGNKSITPFIDKMMYYRDYYKPFFLGIDSTSTQKNMAELINLHYMKTENYDANLLSSNRIEGMSFSGNKKYTYLISLKLMLETRGMIFPSTIGGISSQLANYNPEKDKHIAQDIVATMAMSAYAMRIAFNVTLEKLFNKDSVPVNTMVASRQARLPDSGREKRSYQARSGKTQKSIGDFTNG